LTDYSFLRFLPSVVAASAVFLARWTLDQSDLPWVRTKTLNTDLCTSRENKFLFSSNICYFLYRTILWSITPHTKVLIFKCAYALYGNCSATPVDALSMLYVKSIGTKRYAINLLTCSFSFLTRHILFCPSHATLLGFSDSGCISHCSLKV
jgi:hypothetical protein